MRKGLALGAVLASLFLAGCGGGTGETGPSSEQSAAPETSASSQPERTSPPKSLDLADQCAIITGDQAKQLGADQEPRAVESSGVPGCRYNLGASGGGFMVFVGADKSQTMQQFADARKSSIEMTDISGYPTAQLGTNKTNCTLSVDVSDQGSLFVNALVSSGDPNPCDLSKRFAEAALQNLPGA
ncbi:DUF3558 domain-containing protein [Saccharopolyspora indica]|uniref:DUF3558 domain-containing protein n=1 Tax=Saccharopolyspora indica TaxID=1229659 RepID=UPI0022EB567B|nr:DUF3558 domain-containing protein [Saccharopolyspora indica]MDA3650187.1 DUF3558 domain-containing protein [Saccharopolyspora indica]